MKKTLLIFAAPYIVYAAYATLAACGDDYDCARVGDAYVCPPDVQLPDGPGVNPAPADAPTPPDSDDSDSDSDCSKPGNRDAR